MDKVSSTTHALSPQYEPDATTHTLIPQYEPKIRCFEHFPMDELLNSTLPLPASGLTIDKHFSSEENEEATVEFLKYINNLEYNVTDWAKKLYEEIEARKLYLTNQTICNEVALRFTVADPLVMVICYLYKLKIAVEESFDYVEDYSFDITKTPGTRAQHNVSGRSKADYMAVEPVGNIFQLSDEKGYITHLIFETKMRRFRKNVVAQSLGYYIKTQNIIQSPIVCVITEESMCLIFFPFNTKKNYFVNAISTSYFKYSNTTALSVILKMCDPRDGKFTLSPNGRSLIKKKTVNGKIKISDDSLIQRLDFLQARIDELEAEPRKRKTSGKKEIKEARIDKLEAEPRKRKTSGKKEMKEKLRVCSKYGLRKRQPRNYKC